MARSVCDVEDIDRITSLPLRQHPADDGSPIRLCRSPPVPPSWLASSDRILSRIQPVPARLLLSKKASIDLCNKAQSVRELLLYQDRRQRECKSSLPTANRLMPILPLISNASQPDRYLPHPFKRGSGVGKVCTWQVDALPMQIPVIVCLLHAPQIRHSQEEACR